jgi:2-iminobutanoate/2-iminopropanoate deaminase
VTGSTGPIPERKIMSPTRMPGECGRFALRDTLSRGLTGSISPGIRVGDMIFLSGMGPVDPVTGGRNLGPVAEQVRQTLGNMGHMLESAGSSLDRIVKVMVVLADDRDYDEMNRVWQEFFPVDPPARTVCALQLSNGNGVEIECIALPGKNPS